MQIPKRRGEAVRQLKEVHDRYLTREAMVRMQREHDRLRSVERPKAIEETQRTAEMGDFSENVAYQIAKANLRRINNRMTSITERLKQAILIESGVSKDGYARIGSVVVLKQGKETRTYEIVGAQETNPSKGRISHLSPLGKRLLGCTVGETLTFPTPSGDKKYRVISVS